MGFELAELLHENFLARLGDEALELGEAAGFFEQEVKNVHLPAATDDLESALCGQCGQLFDDAGHGYQAVTITPPGA